MLDEATLATMVLMMGWVIYHCREWKKERAQFAHWLEMKSDGFAIMGGDAMEALEDIVDGLQSVSNGGGSTHTPSGIGEILTALVMNQMQMPKNHGASEERAIQEAVIDQTETETESEPDQPSS